MKWAFLFLFFLSFIPGFSQDHLLLNGQIITHLEDNKGIKINNKTQNFEKITSHGGYFSMRVFLNDTLLVSHSEFPTFRHIVTQKDFETDLLKLDVVKDNLKLLEELKIFKIDALSLGILNKPIKQYTPLERKLKTANGGYEKITLGTMMAFPVDPLLNLLNGRTKEFKKAISLEKASKKEMQILDFFGEDFLINEMKIPEEKLNLFLNYAAYDVLLNKALPTKNKGYCELYLSRAVTRFLKLQNE